MPMLPWKDVVVIPPSAPGMLNIVRYGATDAIGRRVPLGANMMSSRAFKAVQRRLPNPASPDLLPHPYVWSGMIYGHFGHFITETLPRLLSVRAALDTNSDLRILGFSAPGVQSSALQGMRWFLDQIGVDPARIDVITSPARLLSQIVPPQVFVGRYRYASGLLPLISGSGLSAPVASGERIFVSRGKLGHAKSRVTNIAEIEAIYANSGFTILHPELLSFADQVARLTACAVLAGENGSALHWSLYSPYIKQVQSLGWSLALQRGICDLRGQAYVDLRTPWLGALKGRSQHIDPRIVLRHLA